MVDGVNHSHIQPHTDCAQLTGSASTIVRLADPLELSSGIQMMPNHYVIYVYPH